MKEKTEKIQFQNTNNPNANFDLIKIEDLFRRKNLNHSIENHHLVKFYIIFFVEEGKGFHSIDFKKYKCERKVLLTIRKDQIQKFFISKNLKGSLLLFTDDFLVSYLEEMETQKTMLLFNELLGVPKLQFSESQFLDIQKIINRIKNEYFKINDQHSLGIIRSELHILISKLFRIKSQNKNVNFEKKHLKKFIHFQNLVEQKVAETNKVKDFAKMLGVNPKTLNNLTKSIVHQSAKEFIDEICIKQIKRLLINTELSVKEIAYQSGFEETTNFYKYFKKNTQTTPEQFRSSY